MGWRDLEARDPMRTDTLTGMQAIHDAGVRPDLIYVDASHAYKDVLQDLETAKRLFPDAHLFGDDWWWVGSVRKAVKRFAVDNGFEIRHHGNCWLFRQGTPGRLVKGAPGAD